MGKLKSTQAFKGLLFVFVGSITCFGADGWFDNLVANQKAGIGGGIDQNHRLSVFSPLYEVGAGKGPLWVYRNGSPNSYDGGSSWTLSGSDAAIRGFCYWGNAFSAVVAAYSSLDYNNSTALIAADNNATFSAKLAYKDGLGNRWPGYFLTQNVNSLQYGINVRNPNGTDAGGSASGILFSVENVGEFGKGAIVYERKKSWGRGSFHFLQEPNTAATNPGLANKVMTITNSGQVGIGIEPVSTANKLEVLGNAAIKGTVYCNALTVTATISPWPDYILNKSYKVQPLSETEAFIKKNGHLPGMPSSKEVAKNGINVGDMQAKLLKTMEEMTLQMIAQNKKIEELAKANEDLSRKIMQRN